VPAVFVLVEIRHVALLNGVTNVTYFGLVDWALQGGVSDWRAWFSPEMPGGTAALVRTGLASGADVVRLGQGLAIATGALGLLGIFLFARTAGSSLPVALVGQVALGMNERYLADGGLEGSDMPTTGLMTLGVALAASALSRSEGQVAAGDKPPPYRTSTGRDRMAGMVLAAVCLLGAYVLRAPTPHMAPVGLLLGLAAVVVVAGWLFTRLLSRTESAESPVAWAGLAVAAIGVVLVLQGPAAARYVTNQPRMPEKVVALSDALRGAGVQAPSEVLSTESDLQDLGDPARLRFPLVSSVNPDPSTLSALVEDARNRGFRFLVFGPEGERGLPRLAQLANPSSRPAGLIPTYADTTQRVAIYRLAAEIPPPPQVSVEFEGGIGLDGVRVTAARQARFPSGWTVGVYLRWAPRTALTTSYRSFVTLADGAGKPIGHDERVPAVGTYSTTAWKPGETLLDYHAVLLTDPVPATLTMQVGFVDPQNRRLRRIDAARGAIDDKAVVGKLVLETGVPRFRPVN
jgi:hypothetical protein